MMSSCGWTDLHTSIPDLPPACVVGFSVDGFDPSDFRHHGIMAPAAILHSVPKRQAEFFAGRWAARRALARLGLADAHVGIGPKGEPLWPAGIVGSISHSHGIAVAMAAPSGACTGIGVDIEHLVGPETEEAIRAYVIDPAELAVLSASGLPMPVALAAAFSAKESFFKGCFPAVGDYFGFEAVRIHALRRQPMQVALTLRTRLSSALPEGRGFDLGCSLLHDRAVLCAFAWHADEARTGLLARRPDAVVTAPIRTPFRR